MKNSLTFLLRAYLAQHHPDLLFEVERENGVNAFIAAAIESLGDQPDELARQGTPAYVIEEICMEQLTQGFRPSRYDYLLSLLEDEFNATFAVWAERDLLSSVVLILLRDCGTVFDRFGFCEQNEDDEQLRDEMITVIQRSLRTPDSVRQVDLLLERVLDN